MAVLGPRRDRPRGPPGRAQGAGASRVGSLGLRGAVLSALVLGAACGRLQYTITEDPSGIDAAIDPLTDATIDPLTDAAIDPLTDAAIDPLTDAAMAPPFDGSADGGPPSCFRWVLADSTRGGPASIYRMALGPGTVFANIEPQGVDLGGGALSIGSIVRADLETGVWLGGDSRIGLARLGDQVYSSDPVRSVARDGSLGPILIDYDVVPVSRQVSIADGIDGRSDFAWVGMPSAAHTFRGMPYTTDGQDVVVGLSSSARHQVVTAVGHQFVHDVALLEDGSVAWILDTSADIVVAGVPIAGLSAVLLWSPPTLDAVRLVPGFEPTRVESVAGRRLILTLPSAVVAVDIDPTTAPAGVVEAWRADMAGSDTPAFDIDALGGVTIVASNFVTGAIHVERRIIATGALDLMRELPAVRMGLRVATRWTPTSHAIVIGGYTYEGTGLTLCGTIVAPPGESSSLFIARIE